MTGQLDLKNGKQVSKDNADRNMDMHQYKSIIHINPYGKKKDIFSIERSDGVAFDLIRMQYMFVDAVAQNLEICHKESGTCTNVTFPTSPLYVRIIYKKGEIEVRYLSPQQRKEFLETMNEANRVN